MTFIYELDPCSLNIYRVCKYELPTLRLSKIIVWQTQPKLYTTPPRRWTIRFVHFCEPTITHSVDGLLRLFDEIVKQSKRPNFTSNVIKMWQLPVFGPTGVVGGLKANHSGRFSLSFNMLVSFCIVTVVLCWWTSTPFPRCYVYDYYSSLIRSFDYWCLALSDFTTVIELAQI